MLFCAKHIGNPTSINIDFAAFQVRVDENMSLMSGKSEPLGPYIVWLFIYCIFLLPILFICYIITWFFVISIPMAKVNWEMIKLLFTKPRSLTISDSYEGAQNHHVLLCTHQAFNASYFKHSVWGMNIVFFSTIDGLPWIYIVQFTYFHLQICFHL